MYVYYLTGVHLIGVALCTAIMYNDERHYQRQWLSGEIRLNYATEDVTNSFHSSKSLVMRESKTFYLSLARSNPKGS